MRSKEKGQHSVSGDNSPDSDGENIPPADNESGHKRERKPSTNKSSGENRRPIEKDSSWPWIGALLKSEGFCLVRKQIFSFLPALDLLQCRRQWQLESDMELRARPKMVWHTEHGHDCPTLTAQSRALWRNVFLFCRELRARASHVFVMLTTQSLLYYTGGSCGPAGVRQAISAAVDELVRHLPSDCIVSGAVAQNGLIVGSSNNRGGSTTYVDHDMVVTLFVLGLGSDLQLFPAAMLRGRVIPSNLLPVGQPNPSGHQAEEESLPEKECRNLAMCLGTQETGIQGYLRAENPHPAFFLGNSPTVESFSNWRPVFCTRDGQMIPITQCLLVDGPGVGSMLVTANSIASASHLDHVRRMYSRKQQEISSAPRQGPMFRRRPLTAIQLVAYHTVSAESTRRFRSLLHDCTTIFHDIFPNLPLRSVLARSSLHRRLLTLGLVETAAQSFRMERMAHYARLRRGEGDAGGCRGAGKDPVERGMENDHRPCPPVRVEECGHHEGSEALPLHSIQRGASLAGGGLYESSDDSDDVDGGKGKGNAFMRFEKDTAVKINNIEPSKDEDNSNGSRAARVTEGRIDSVDSGQNRRHHGENREGAARQDTSTEARSSGDSGHNSSQREAEPDEDSGHNSSQREAEPDEDSGHNSSEREAEPDEGSGHNSSEREAEPDEDSGEELEDPRLVLSDAEDGAHFLEEFVNDNVDEEFEDEDDAVDIGYNDYDDFCFDLITLIIYKVERV